VICKQVVNQKNYANSSKNKKARYFCKNRFDGRLAFVRFIMRVNNSLASLVSMFQGKIKFPVNVQFRKSFLHDIKKNSESGYSQKGEGCCFVG
jgi:hypothetical protein